MNGNKGILLDDTALRQLYAKNTLYQLESKADDITEDREEEIEKGKETDESGVHTKPEETGFKLEGNPNADLLLVFFHEGTSALPEAGQQTVKGLVENPKAMNRALDQTALINWNTQSNNNWEALLEQVVAKNILCWGEFPMELDLEPNKYQALEHHGRSYILSDVPAILEGNAGLKGKLWQAIKTNWL